MNWDSLFGLHIPVLEIVIRGTAVYWFLFIVFRSILRRDVGAVGIADVLLLVLIADASQNAMAGEYRSITEGALLVSTIVGWNWVLDWASAKSEWVAHFTTPAPLTLVRNGRVHHANLRREMLSMEELESKLRLEGVEKLADVKIARLEPDGEISVIRVGREPGQRPRRKRAGVG
jgi:uncharacterized membrane protein YcaP (DUF421 family)